MEAGRILSVEITTSIDKIFGIKPIFNKTIYMLSHVEDIPG